MDVLRKNSAWQLKTVSSLAMRLRVTEFILSAILNNTALVGLFI